MHIGGFKFKICKGKGIWERHLEFDGFWRDKFVCLLGVDAENLIKFPPILFESSLRIFSNKTVASIRSLRALSFELTFTAG